MSVSLRVFATGNKLNNSHSECFSSPSSVGTVVSSPQLGLDFVSFFFPLPLLFICDLLGFYLNRLQAGEDDTKGGAVQLPCSAFTLKLHLRRQKFHQSTNWPRKAP